ncbi:7717_t:CDS:2 [Entrophospora sp. SA101]|nr:7717_t:CDS:2 [Entrophospora sp. SA101]CAJ0868616.1 11513_t:CDS:2 [Entrophospora sp. SA101]CAJ0897093.1 5946_t:CDS:2 [Entrophospora sp. SA101]
MKQNWEESSEFLTESEFKDLQQIFSSSLELKKLKTWKNIDNDADILLHNLSKVNFQKLQQMGESMLSEGTQGTLELLRTLLKDEDNNSKIDHLNTDVCYILNLLRFSCEIIKNDITKRKNTERDIDVFIKSHIFSCFDGVVDRHFGEPVSRASRECCQKVTENAEGYHLDWLFSVC